MSLCTALDSCCFLRSAWTHAHARGQGPVMSQTYACPPPFEQRTVNNQLPVAEEFGHAPTDAKRLAGVISLAAVIGGPHPHQQGKLVDAPRRCKGFSQAQRLSSGDRRCVSGRLKFFDQEYDLFLIACGDLD